MNVAELINSVGVPVVVVLLLLDKVVALVRARFSDQQQRAPTSGEKTPEWWEAKIQKIVNESLSQILVPALERQSTLQEQENAQLGRLNEQMAVMLDRSDGRRSASPGHHRRSTD